MWIQESQKNTPVQLHRMAKNADRTEPAKTRTRTFFAQISQQVLRRSTINHPGNPDSERNAGPRYREARDRRRSMASASPPPQPPERPLTPRPRPLPLPHPQRQGHSFLELDHPQEFLSPHLKNRIQSSLPCLFSYSYIIDYFFSRPYIIEFN